MYHIKPYVIDYQKVIIYRLLIKIYNDYEEDKDQGIKFLLIKQSK